MYLCFCYQTTGLVLIGAVRRVRLFFINLTHRVFIMDMGTGVNETWSIYLRFKFMFDNKPEADAQ